MLRILFLMSMTILMLSCNEKNNVESTIPKEVDETPLPSVKTPEEDLGKFGFKEGLSPKDNPIAESDQLVIVVVPDDETIQGVMYQFERVGENWQQEGKTILVSIGKNGLAWGKGEMDERVMRGFRKQEGDGKAPAGIFTFGKAFGYAGTEEATAFKLPYVQSTDTYFCVDDVNSAYYNSVVTTDDVNKDWNSAEDMLRKDGLYEWGVFVNHNTPADSGDGSCILMHVWRGQGKPTAGCTATSKINLLKVLHWLDPEKNPRLVQITKDGYPQMKNWFGLPDIPL